MSERLRQGRPELFFASESLAAGNGGIARVARLIARVIADERRSGRLGAAAIALSDLVAPPDLALPAKAMCGSRARYVLDVHRAALTHSHFIYDFLGMARAHPRVRLLRKPHLVFIHGIEVWEATRRDRLAAARRASMLVANSHYTRARADRLHGIFGRAHVCWLATESDSPPSLMRRPGPPRVLVCGRMEAEYKGHRALLEAWPEVANAIPDARLTFVGRGTERLRSSVALTRQSERIELRGFVSEAELEQSLTDATVFAMPSRGEGFGIVYIEAMRHGVPIVASIHDAAQEINIEGETGFNVDLDEPGQLAERLIHLLRNQDEAARMGDNGRHRWERYFRYSAFRERFLPLMNTLLAL